MRSSPSHSGLRVGRPEYLTKRRPKMLSKIPGVAGRRRMWQEHGQPVELAKMNGRTRIPMLSCARA